MKLLFDVFPLVLFFIAYQRFGIYAAAGAAIAATALQVAYLLVRRKTVPGMVWVSLVVVVVFGGATILLHNDTFIKWKPTVLYWVGALLLAGGELVGKSGLRGLLGSELSMPDLVWKRLTWIWVLFLAFLGALNLFVAYTYSMDTWVTFKVVGLLSIMIVFVLAQGLFLSKYVQSEDER